MCPPSPNTRRQNEHFLRLPVLPHKSLSAEQLLNRRRCYQASLQQVICRKIVESPTTLLNLAANKKKFGVSTRACATRPRSADTGHMASQLSRKTSSFLGERCLVWRSFRRYLVLELLHPALRQAVDVDGLHRVQTILQRLYFPRERGQQTHKKKTRNEHVRASAGNGGKLLRTSGVE